MTKNNTACYNPSINSYWSTLIDQSINPSTHLSIDWSERNAKGTN